VKQLFVGFGKEDRKECKLCVGQEVRKQWILDVGQEGRKECKLCVGQEYSKQWILGVGQEDMKEWSVGAGQENRSVNYVSGRKIGSSEFKVSDRKI
jgi:hypothetical protein